MVECPHPRVCAALINELQAHCSRCYVRDPAVTAAIELARAKANPALRTPKAPRRTWSKGLGDAARVRKNGTANAPRRTVS